MALLGIQWSVFWRSLADCSSSFAGKKCKVALIRRPGDEARRVLLLFVSFARHVYVAG